MRLVTYDRGGARRLGAWVGNAVVDLPDAVGHPAFPTTMEALVTRHGGTILEAARHALASPQHAGDCTVADPRLLVPIIPASLLEFENEVPPRPGTRRRRKEEPGEATSGNRPAGGADRKRTLFGPEEQLPWPPSAGALRFGLEVACVLGKAGRDLSPPQAARLIFGYTLKITWSIDRPARRRNAATNGRPAQDFATCLGPCVVTRDEFDPSDARLAVTIDGRVAFDGGLGPIRRRLADMIAHVSKESPVCPGDIFGLAVATEAALPVGGIGPGARLDVRIDGLGALRSHVGRPPRARKRAASFAFSRPALAH